MHTVKQLVSIVIPLMMLSPAYAIYLGQNNNGKSLPAGAVIPPLVSILDATDNNGTADMYPDRTFKLAGFYSWTFQHDCAATLIGVDSKNNLSYVFTSAHCVTSPAAKTIDNPWNKRIVVGNQWCELASSGAKQCKTVSTDQDPAVYAVNAIYVNKNWFAAPGNNFLDNDFAILQVKGILKLNSKQIAPMHIAYQQKDWQQQEPLYIAGWGTTSPSQFINFEHNKTPMTVPYQQPNYAPVSSMTALQCQNQLQAVSKMLFPGDAQTYAISPKNQICSGLFVPVSTPYTDSSVCYGDSGGPLFSASDDPSKWGGQTQFTLVGNVSGTLALCSPALCAASMPQPGSTPSQVELTSNCYNAASRNHIAPVPNVFGFPGAMLCSSDAMTSPIWYEVHGSISFNPIPIKGINPQSLGQLTSGELTPYCK